MAEMWKNPQTGMEHCVGQRVMWAYERKQYAECGEIGTVVSVPNDADPEAQFAVQMDQPRNKKDTNSGRLMHFTTDSLLTLREARLRTAARLRRVADDYQADADRFDENGMPLPVASVPPVAS